MIEVITRKDFWDKKEMINRKKDESFKVDKSRAKELNDLNLIKYSKDKSNDGLSTSKK